MRTTVAKAARLFAAMATVGAGEVLAGTGANQFDPILPTTITTDASGNPVFRFVGLVSDRWYDPPTVSGYRITVGAAWFTSLVIPVGFGPLTLTLGDGTFLASSLTASSLYVFSGTPRSIVISGIQPLLDPSSSNFASAFPLLLRFSGISSAQETMEWTAIQSPVPESSTYSLMLVGLGALVLGLGSFGTRRKP